MHQNPSPKRLAVIDLFFTWPPHGGACVDVKETLERLAPHIELKLFVARFDRFFPRGRITSPLPFPVEEVRFDLATFTVERIQSAFREAVDRFAPDEVLVANGHFLKPLVAEAFVDRYPTSMRYFTYEVMCPARDGIFFRNGHTCLESFYTTGNMTRCRLCAFTGALFTPGIRKYLIHEILVSGAFSAAYPDRVRALMPRIRQHIVYNDLAAGFIRAMGGTPAVFPSGVDTDRFVPRALPTRPDAKPRLLFAGRADAEFKGFALLLEACRRLEAAGREFELLVTWKPESQYLPDTAWAKPIGWLPSSVLAPVNAWHRRRWDRDLFMPSFVKRVDWLGPGAIVDLYNSADLCVFPSIWQEPLGIVTLEAMSCGRPVVVSDVAGFRQTVTEGQTGRFFPAGDPAALATLLAELLDDPAQRARLGAAARRDVVTRFDWRRLLDRYYRPWLGFGQASDTSRNHQEISS
ncbi:MAG TPA: glycosyltransferase family 4 protein [Candidatus Ozemobacteraceae bacterium]|nr:glycosyltransferase family 4 protein [Candidatus Ozemobacteraceae bacterium]